MLQGGDSISAAGVPLTVDVGFGYIWHPKPAWRSFSPLVKRLSPKPVYGITTSTRYPGNFLDVEKTDAVPSDFPGWWDGQFPSNVAVGLPTGCYMSVTLVDTVFALAQQASIPRVGYKLWSAHYGAGKHLCGPKTCGLCSIDVDGTQWNNMPAWDESLLLDSFIHPVPQLEGTNPMNIWSDNGKLVLAGNDPTNHHTMVMKEDPNTGVWTCVDITDQIGPDHTGRLYMIV